MTLPSVRSYLRSVLRYWYVIVACLVIAAGTSFWLSDSSAQKITVGDVVFTIVADDQGQESGGTARLAEDQLALQRLTAYATVASTRAETQQILSDAGIDAPANSPWTSLTSPERLILTAAPGGLVSVQLENGPLTDGQAVSVVQQVQEIVARTAVELDTRQSAPSIASAPVVAVPQTIITREGNAGGVTPLGLLVPLVLGGSLGLLLVFVLAWRFRRVEDRRDLEERLELSVLGEVAPRNEEGYLVVAQALARTTDSSGATRVLIACAPHTGQASVVVEGLVKASRVLAATTVPVATGGHGDGRSSASEAPRVTAARTTELVDLTDTEGVSRELIAAASSADQIGIVVRYGRTPMRDLERMLVSLSDASSTPLRAIGVSG